MWIYCILPFLSSVMFTLRCKIWEMSEITIGVACIKGPLLNNDIVYLPWKIIYQSKGIDVIKSWFLQSPWKIIPPDRWFNGFKEIRLSWCIVFIEGIYYVMSLRTNVGDKLKSKTLEWRVILTKMLGCATSIRWAVLAQLPYFQMLHDHIRTRACLSCVLGTCRNTFIFSASLVANQWKGRKKGRESSTDVEDK